MFYIAYDKDGRISKISEMCDSQRRGESTYIVPNIPPNVNDCELYFRGRYPYKLDIPWKNKRSGLRVETPTIFWTDSSSQRAYSLHHMGWNNTQALKDMGMDARMIDVEELVNPELKDIYCKSLIIYQIRSGGYPYQDIPVPIECGYFVCESTLVPRYFVRRLNMMDHVFTPSMFSKNSLMNSGCKVPITVWRHGVDCEVFKPLGVKHDDVFRFVYVGASMPRKGLDLAIEAFSKAFDKTDKVLFTFRIANDYVVLDLAEKFGVLDNVRVITEQLDSESLCRLYNESNVFVSASRGESFGLPVLESAACGVPAIYTDGHAFSEFASGYPVKVAKKVEEKTEDWEAWETHGEWFECDVDDLANQMRNAFEDRKELKLKSNQALMTARSMSWTREAQAAKSVLQGLQHGN